MRRVLLLALLLGATSPAGARECGEGRVSGSTTVSGDAIGNFECAMLGRVYCRLAEDRDLGVAQDESTRRTADWLDRLNRTGSNLKGSSVPIVKMAAADVYRQRDRRPGPIYYRTVYGCGVLKRVAGSAEAQQQAAQAFEAEADRCEKEHALRGRRSFPNQPLRECLKAAVDRVAVAKPKPKPKP
jgi:hypothetical protein